MLLIFPMGGIGLRFREAGYTIPKPLLTLGDKRLLELAVESTRLLTGSYEYIASKDVLHACNAATLKVPGGCWHELESRTRGPLETMLAFRDCLSKTDHPALLCDCDSFMNPQELQEAVEFIEDSGAAGGITIRKTTDPACSFATVDSEWWVTETREKDAFSPWSSTGPYWWRSIREFLTLASVAMREGHRSVSPVYNYLLRRGRQVKAVPVSSFVHLGTPEELERWQSSQTSL